MEDQHEKRQPECPYCGRPLPPSGLCSCPQARTVANLRRPAPPAAPKREPLGWSLPKFLPAADDDEFDFYEEDERAERTLEEPEPLRLAGRQTSAFRNFFPFLAAYFRRPFQAMEAACRSRDLSLALLCLPLFLAGGGLFTAALAHQGGRFLQQLLNDVASLTPFALSVPSRLWVKPGEFFICGLLMALCWVLLAGWPKSG